MAVAAANNFKKTLLILSAARFIHISLSFSNFHYLFGFDILLSRFVFFFAGLDWTGPPNDRFGHIYGEYILDNKWKKNPIYLVIFSQIIFHLILSLSLPQQQKNTLITIYTLIAIFRSLSVIRDLSTKISFCVRERC